MTTARRLEFLNRERTAEVGSNGPCLETPRLAQRASPAVTPAPDPAQSWSSSLPLTRLTPGQAARWGSAIGSRLGHASVRKKARRAAPAGKSAVPTTAQSPAAPAGWHPDPFARHESRYWDGAVWTDHVKDGDVPGTDPATFSYCLTDTIVVTVEQRGRAAGASAREGSPRGGAHRVGQELVHVSGVDRRARRATSRKSRHEAGANVA